MTRSGVDLIGMWINKSTKYNDKKQSDKRETSIGFGIGAIFSSLFTMAFAYLGSSGLLTLTHNDVSDSSKLIDMFVRFNGNITLGVLALVVGGLCALVLIFNSMLDVIYQLKLNKKVIGFIALILFLVSIVLSGFLFYSAL